MGDEGAGSVVSPRAVSVCRWAVGVCPRAFGGCPRAVGGCPRAVGGCPRAVGGCPRAVRVFTRRRVSALERQRVKEVREG